MGDGRPRIAITRPSLSYNVIPTGNESGVIQIEMQLALFNIISMVSGWQAAHCLAVPQNEKAQTITTNCERILKWNDMFLRSDLLTDAFETMVTTTISRWNPAEFGNITETRLPWDKVRSTVRLAVHLPFSRSGSRTSSSTTLQVVLPIQA